MKEKDDFVEEDKPFEMPIPTLLKKYSVGQEVEAEGNRYKITAINSDYFLVVENVETGFKTFIEERKVTKVHV